MVFQVSTEPGGSLGPVGESPLGEIEQASRTILIVEDNVLMRNLFRRCLEEADFSVIEVLNPLQLLNIMRDVRPDLVTLDILMPEISGFELIKAIRTDSELANTPVVAVTSLAGPGDRQRLRGAGFNGHIAKPIKPKEFAAQLAPYFDRAAAIPTA
jgi:two-component system, cell cycle response regulator DivK